MINQVIKDRRIRIIIGHYGSGKTEFAVNYALALAKVSQRPLALADLDVVNPYFRSRERHQLLENAGISVISSMLGNNVNFDLPSIDPAVLGPLQNDDYDVILDVGGDHTGARVMARFTPYLVKGHYDMFAVINTNRPQTADVAGISQHLHAIENTVQRPITGLINNTHLLKETSIDEVLAGQAIIREAAKQLQLEIIYTSVMRDLAEQMPAETAGAILPIDMHMRDAWM